MPQKSVMSKHRTANSLSTNSTVSQSWKKALFIDTNSVEHEYWDGITRRASFGRCDLASESDSDAWTPTNPWV